MSVLVWDEPTEHFYETGVKKGVLYTKTTTAYDTATAWNGIISISESPSGAEANPFYADDIKYLNLLSNEDFGLTLEAYSSPKAFDACDGSASLATGLRISQQPRETFGLCYRTTLGNDEDGNEYGYKLHLVYGCTAAPSERAYSTINESPEPMTLSWEITTVPVKMTGYNNTAHIEIDSTKVNATKLANLEAKLYGSGSTGAPGAGAYLPLPNEVKTTLV